MHSLVRRFVSLLDFAKANSEFSKNVALIEKIMAEEERREAELATNLLEEMESLNRIGLLKINCLAVDVLFALEDWERPATVVDYFHSLLDRKLIEPQTRHFNLKEVLRTKMRMGKFRQAANHPSSQGV